MCVDNSGVYQLLFLKKGTNVPLMDKNVNKKIMSVIKKKGIESWFNLENKEFLTDDYNPQNYLKVNSILDVWFDSGASHAYVLKNEK